MNKFDIRYEIRRAGIQDKAKIMDFIKHQWKKTHILANDSSFFDYEFREEEDLNFIVAFEKQNDELAGIIGYIKASNNTELLDVWGVMWKVADSLNPMPFLGLELMKRMISYTKCRAEIGVGANIHTSVPMLKMFLKFEVNKMDHFYRIADLNDYKIADINKKIFVAQSCAANSYLQVIRNVGELETLFDFSQFKNMIPYKDL